MDLFSDSRDVSATAFWIQPQGSQPDPCVCVSDKVVSEGVVCDKVVCGEWAAEAGEGGEVADGSAQQKQEPHTKMEGQHIYIYSNSDIYYTIRDIV